MITDEIIGELCSLKKKDIIDAYQNILMRSISEDGEIIVSGTEATNVLQELNELQDRLNKEFTDGYISPEFYNQYMDRVSITINRLKDLEA